MINHLMYMDDIKLFAKKIKKELQNLIQRIKIFSPSSGMGFGIEECAVLIMRSGKRQITEGIELSNQERIKMFEVKETYKYFEILKMDHIKQAEMKEKKKKTRKDYLR